MVYTFFDRKVTFLKALEWLSTLLIVQVLDLVLSHSDEPNSLFCHSGPTSISKSRVMNLEGISSIRFSYRVNRPTKWKGWWHSFTHPWQKSFRRKHLIFNLKSSFQCIGGNSSLSSCITCFSFSFHFIRPPMRHIGTITFINKINSNRLV